MSLIICALLYISKLNDTPTDDMTFQKLIIKGQKVNGGPVLEIPTTSPNSWNNPHTAYQVTLPIKTNHISQLLDGPNTVCGVCFFLGYFHFPRWHCALESRLLFEMDPILPMECYITTGHTELPIVFCACYQGKSNEEGNSVLHNWSQSQIYVIEAQEPASGSTGSGRDLFHVTPICLYTRWRCIHNIGNVEGSNVLAKQLLLWKC